MKSKLLQLILMFFLAVTFTNLHCAKTVSASVTGINSMKEASEIKSNNKYPAKTKQKGYAELYTNNGIWSCINASDASFNEALYTIDTDSDKLIFKFC